jgi:hypothetical protein
VAVFAEEDGVYTVESDEDVIFSAQLVNSIAIENTAMIDFIFGLYY